MKRPLAYVTAAWRGDECEITEQAAKYCRIVYDAGYSPICPMLFLPLFLCSSMTRCRRSIRTASTWGATCSGAPVCWWCVGTMSMRR